MSPVGPLRGGSASGLLKFEGKVARRVVAEPSGNFLHAEIGARQQIFSSGKPDLPRIRRSRACRARSGRSGLFPRADARLCETTEARRVIAKPEAMARYPNWWARQTLCNSANRLQNAARRITWTGAKSRTPFSSQASSVGPRNSNQSSVQPVSGSGRYRCQ